MRYSLAASVASYARSCVDVGAVSEESVPLTLDCTRPVESDVMFAVPVIVIPPW